MSANKRKQLRRKNHSCIDYQASTEANAIANGFTSHTIDFGQRLNRYYWCDGYKFNTGKKHRANCVGMTKVKHATHVRKRHKSEHINLASINAHKRIEAGKKAYDVLEAKRIQHLNEYRAGLVRPTNSKL